MIDPVKCNTDQGWDVWQIGFLNKLGVTMGAAKVPVDSIVHKEVDEGFKFEDDDEMRMHQMPLKHKFAKADFNN